MKKNNWIKNLTLPDERNAELVGELRLFPGWEFTAQLVSSFEKLIEPALHLPAARQKLPDFQHTHV